MAQLSVDRPSSSPREASAFRTSLKVVLRNGTTESVEVDPFLIRIPSLVLQVKDPDGKPVGLPPPPFPPPEGEMEGRSLKEIPPGGSLDLQFQSFLDWDAPPGEYSARYRSTHPLTGGSPEKPLISEWVQFCVTPPPRMALPTEFPPVAIGEAPWIDKERGEVARRMSGIPQSPAGPCPNPWGKEFVEAYFSRVADNPPVGSRWTARFRVEVQETPTPEVLVRVRVQVEHCAASLDLNSAWRQWEEKVECKWSNRFKVRCGEGEEAVEMPIRVGLVRVGNPPTGNARNRHMIRMPGALDSPRGRPRSTLREWLANDVHGVSHEVGHVLGNRDEYGKYANGEDYGCWYQEGGNIMNNPLGRPEPKHFHLICWAVAELRGCSCRIIPIEGSG